MKLHLSVIFVTIALLGTLVSPPALSQTADLRPLFPSRADVYVSSGRLARVELPPEVLSACRADLSDLRIIDAAGREVPYRIDSEPAGGAERRVERTFSAELLEVDRQTVNRDSGPPLLRETYELAAPPEPSRTGAWDLVFETRRPRFVRRVRVQTEFSGGHRPTVIDGASIFRLGVSSQEKTHLTLADGPLQRVIVTLEGEESFFLEPGFRFEESLVIPDERVAVDLIEVGRSETADQTTIELARPRGLVPAALEVVTSTRTFNRRVEVKDQGPGGGNRALGRRAVYRVPGFTTAEELEVPVSRARGDRLTVVIDNGDSPALEELSFRAIIRRPALVFALENAGADQASGTLYFGGGRAHRPRYDVGRTVQATPADGNRAAYTTARLGPVEANSVFDASPVLAFAMRPGAEIDSSSFTHRRRLGADPSPEGLNRVRLGLDDMARARQDIADLRIVDDASQQWAYLIERDADHEFHPLGIGARESVDGISRYQLSLPAVPAILDRLVLRSPVPYLDRPYRLVAGWGEQEFVLAQGRLTKANRGTAPQTMATVEGSDDITIDLPAKRLDSLELIIEDGDDAPLALTAVSGRFPVGDIYFAAPAGTYYLLVGNPEAVAPSYELARVRDLILAVPSAATSTDPLADNDAFSPASRLTSASGTQQILLWIALGLPVVFLTGLTLRLARKEETATD